MFFALVIPVDLGAEIRNYNPAKVCRSYDHHPTFRSARCINLYLKEIKKVLDNWYEDDHNIPAAGTITVKFYSERETEIVRNLINGPVLGLAKQFGGMTYEVLILTPTDRFKQPVDIVIIHELTHVMDFHNNIMNTGSPAAEIMARDVAVTVYFALFK